MSSVRVTAIPESGRYTLANASVPACLVDGPVPEPDEDGLTRLDISIVDGKILALQPAGRLSTGDWVDLDGGQVWPCFVDIHTHFDKGHIWPRTPNPDGTFDSALEAVQRDRDRYWTETDVAARFDFGLRCAYHHGTRAIRTHLDNTPPHHEVAWPVFAKLRDAWADRIALQGVSLVPIDLMVEPFATELARMVADYKGILGAATFMVPDLDDYLDRTVRLAKEHGLDLDFHVDERLDPGARSLERIVAAIERNAFSGQTLVGHCCSLSVQPDDIVASILNQVSRSRIAVVSLPMCNLYLQDRQAGRTPRRRGVTLLHEIAEAGIPLCVASDNCRDPFYGFGDHDPLEVFCQAVRIGHLDRPVSPWPTLVTRTPADIMGFERYGRIAESLDADLVLFKARGFSELLSRHQSDRTVLRRGQPIDAPLPDYRELDHLLEGAR
ncbi:MAG: cytosine deaminase [Geminicoccaceae bacterium]